MESICSVQVRTDNIVRRLEDCEFWGRKAQEAIDDYEDGRLDRDSDGAIVESIEVTLIKVKVALAHIKKSTREDL